MQKKWVSWLLAGIGFAGLAAGAIAYGMANPEVREAINPAAVSGAKEAEHAKASPVAASRATDTDLPMGNTGIDPFIDANPTEQEFMEVIHHMTHQKVEAWPKWGALRITAARIDELLMILDNAAYDNEGFYREALTAWKNGDFSNVVEVHNTIWKWQDGSVGKARSALTDEEEQAFVKRNF